MRWVLCWYGRATVNRLDAGSIPASAASNGRASQRAMAAASKAVERRARLVSSTLTPSAFVSLAERQRLRASNPARRVRLPQGTLSMQASISGSSLLVVMPGFELGVRRFDSYPRNSREQLLRGRLTAGRGALNALVLVRFQLPQLTEAIRLDEDAVLKTAGRASDLGVQIGRASCRERVC